MLLIYIIILFILILIVKKPRVLVQNLNKGGVNQESLNNKNCIKTRKILKLKQED